MLLPYTVILYNVVKYMFNSPLHHLPLVIQSNPRVSSDLQRGGNHIYSWRFCHKPWSVYSWLILLKQAVHTVNFLLFPSIKMTPHPTHDPPSPKLLSYHHHHFLYCNFCLHMAGTLQFNLKIIHFFPIVFEMSFTFLTCYVLMWESNYLFIQINKSQFLWHQLDEKSLGSFTSL